MSVFKGERKILKGMVHPKAKTVNISGRPKSGQILELALILLPDASQKKLRDVKDYHKINRKKINLIEREEFVHKYGANHADVKMVKSFASEFDLKLSKVNINERLIFIKGPIKSIEKAFDVKILKFKHLRKTYLTYHGTISVPKELDAVVESIGGISNEPVVIKRIFPEELRLTHSGFKGTAVFPHDFAEYYKFPKNLDGAGQSIAILTFGGGYKKKYIKQYFKKIGIPLPQIKTKEIYGGKNQPGSDLDSEVYMDIEIAGALAPGAKIVVYFAKNSSMGIITSLRAAIHDKKNRHNVISMSWGILENSNAFNKRELKSLNRVLQEAAALNITVIASSGDLGSSGTLPDVKDFYPDSNIELPASNPYVLAVGGTTVDTLSGAIMDDKVWNQKLKIKKRDILFSSGGGFSNLSTLARTKHGALWSMPPWQRKVMPKNLKWHKMRGIPDVAANASTSRGILLNVNGEEQISFGTSAAAPLWAALIARINQHLESAGLPHAGFINPYLYHNAMSTAFNQVLEGNNGAYMAGPKWNACTGLGTPNGTKLLELLTKAKKRSK